MITVCVPTCGPRPSLSRCLAALEEQVVKTNVVVIRGVAPMSAAFTAMLDATEGSEFFIQCDDDMILQPTAVKRMLEDMERRDPGVALVAHPLWDVHLERPIIGCKIYRRSAIVEVHGWVDTQSCEVEQVERLRKAGYSIDARWDVAWNLLQWSRRDAVIVGEHDPMYTPESAYERYRDLVLKQRRLGHSPWVEDVPGQMLDRITADGPRASDVDIAALAGCIVGATTPLEDASGEKDFIVRPWREGYEQVAHLLGLQIDS